MLRPESVDGARWHEDQCVPHDRQEIEIDLKGRRPAWYPKYLVKIVPMRTLPILAEPYPFFKGADVKLLLSPG